MIHQLITRKVRQEFARSMRFEAGAVPRIPETKQKQPRLLYLHIPFCEKLCPYCSFNRIVFDKSLCREYFQALRLELLLYQKRGFDFQGVYAGGGTPTVLIDELEETLALARDLFQIREISVETNPNHLTDANIAALKRVGVNRLSVGIQSFDNRLLKAMDRFDKYGSGEAIRDRLKQILGQFDTLNADMIFNFPTQTMDILNRDLDVLLEIGIDQITYYPLMVSDFTRELVMKTLGRVDGRQEERFYRRIAERLVPAYRFSSAWCFSRKPAMIDEYIVDYDEYAGLGSGSIGYLNGTCYANTFNIRQYIAQVERGEMPLMASRDFSLKDRIRYDFLMKLFGMKLDIPALLKKYGDGLFRHLWLELVAFRLAGGLRYSPPDYYLTPHGRYYWVIMMREFFTSVNNFRDFCREQSP